MFISYAAVAKVVEHWQNVFRATQLALGPFYSISFLPSLSSLSPPLFSPLSLLLKQWKLIFFERTRREKVASLNQQKEALATTPEEVDQVLLPEGTLPERLLRIPTEYSKNLQAAAATTSEE